MTRFIMFTRVSSKFQLVENQKADCMFYIRQHFKPGDQLIEFEEPETSSRIPFKKRPVVQEMMSFVQEGDVLVMYKLDRLARNGVELVTAYEELTEKIGVKVHSIQEPYVDSKYVHLSAWIAMTERENISARTASTLRRKQADFEKVGQVWYGYKLDPTRLNPVERTKTYKKPYKLLPDAYEQEVISIMKTLRSQGYSYQMIIDELDSLGHKTREGKKYSKMSVSRILQREERLGQAPKDLIAV